MRLPEPGQQIVAEVVHVVGGMVERRQPAHRHVCFVHKIVGKLEYCLYGLRVEKKAEQAEREHGHNSRKLAFFKVKQQHGKHHQQRVEQHQQEYRAHTFIRAAHLQRFHKRGQRDFFPRAGVAQNGCGFRPHVADKALPHADEGCGHKDKRQIEECCEDDIQRLSHEPGFAVDAHQVKRCSRTDERHIRKQQQKQQGGKKY